MNRCYYNTMVDDPMNTRQVVKHNDTLMCRTLEKTCQDCRKVSIDEIYTMHFTLCLKPWKCFDTSTSRQKHLQLGLCLEGQRIWHRLRQDMEDEWARYYPDYSLVDEPPELSGASAYYKNLTFGHCQAGRPQGYANMKFPWDDG